jgi:hypothetical protein
MSARQRPPMTTNGYRITRPPTFCGLMPISDRQSTRGLTRGLTLDNSNDRQRILRHVITGNLWQSLGTPTT